MWAFILSFTGLFQEVAWTDRCVQQKRPHGSTVKAAADLNICRTFTVTVRQRPLVAVVVITAAKEEVRWVHLTCLCNSVTEFMNVTSERSSLNPNHEVLSHTTRSLSLIQVQTEKLSPAATKRHSCFLALSRKRWTGPVLNKLSEFNRMDRWREKKKKKKSEKIVTCIHVS